jgi:polyprenyl P-hydroxybenzoate/phenylacrylic acid decarboxylase-like protein
VKRIVVGMTGATGQIYGIRLLQHLRFAGDVEVHLIMSEWAKGNIAGETDWTPENVEALADYVYDNNNLGAALASGSFLREGMIVIPCSVKTLSAIANSYADNLLVRAADVTLKERKKLIICFRETPMHLGHLRLLTKVSECGAIVAPPLPVFYNNPASIAELIDHSVFRYLDLLGLPSPQAQRWQGSIENL